MVEPIAYAYEQAKRMALASPRVQSFIQGKRA